LKNELNKIENNYKVKEEVKQEIKIEVKTVKKDK
jgi:hypothetical protein